MHARIHTYTQYVHHINDILKLLDCMRARTNGWGVHSTIWYDRMSFAYYFRGRS